MRESTTPSTLRLMKSCMEAMAQLPDQPEQCRYNAEEQALFDRLQQVNDPLAWEDHVRDGEIAEDLWRKMDVMAQQQIQSAALLYSLEDMKPTMSTPLGGFI